MPEIQSRSDADPRRLEALMDRPRVGRASELRPPLARPILAVRLLTYWNSWQIAAEFRRRGVWPLNRGQVDRLLARHGTYRPSYARVPGPRYERPTSSGRSTSRARIRAAPTKEAIWVLALLGEAIELCGDPHEPATVGRRRPHQMDGLRQYS